MLTVTALKEARRAESVWQSLKASKALHITDRITDLELTDFRDLDHVEQLIIGPQLDEMRPGAKRWQRPSPKAQVSSPVVIPPFLFSMLKGLKELRILMKGVRELRKESFAGLNRLETLVLTGNRINSIEPGTFQELANLSSLDLDRNRLVEVDQKHFSELPELVRLNLSTNQLKQIAPRSFAGNEKLLMLDLSYNSLSHLNADSFIGLTNLNHLDLRGNALKENERSFITPLTPTTQISFHTNKGVLTSSKLDLTRK
jgi:Leucine-rich repeat (LRR) protein